MNRRTKNISNNIQNLASEVQNISLQSEIVSKKNVCLKQELHIISDTIITIPKIPPHIGQKRLYPITLKTILV